MCLQYGMGLVGAKCSVSDLEVLGPNSPLAEEHSNTLPEPNRS